MIAFSRRRLPCNEWLALRRAICHLEDNAPVYSLGCFVLFLLQVLEQVTRFAKELQKTVESILETLDLDS